MQRMPRWVAQSSAAATREICPAAVDQHELVEVVVHTAPVINRLVTELAEIADAIGCSHAVEHLLLQIFLQLAGHIPERIQPLPQDLHGLLLAAVLVEVE